MESIMVSAIFTERLAIIASAFVCICFGWNLFRSKIYVGQDGVFSAGEWKVELKKVGPGVFFSLFGAAILTAAFIYPMSFELETKDGSRKFVGRGALPSEGNDEMRFVRAINTLDQVKDAVSAASPSSETVALLRIQANELVLAAERLDELRDQRVVAKFGGNAQTQWKTDRQAYRDNPASLDPKIREQMAKVEPWYTNNMANEKR